MQYSFNKVKSRVTTLVIMNKLEDYFYNRRDVRGVGGHDQNNISIIYQNEYVRRTATFNKVQRFADEIAIELLKISSGNKFIGIGCLQDIYFPSVLLGILRSGNAFYNFESDIKLSLQQKPIELLDISYAFVDSANLHNFENDKIYTMEVVKELTFQACNAMKLREDKNSTEDINLSLFLVKLKYSQADKVNNTIINRIKPFLEKGNIAYAIRTSGTTGNRKLVLVPHDCISSNIESLVQQLQVNETDIIFGSSPPTFDPSIPELFITLYSGSKILYLSSSVKLNPKLLCDALISNKVSILPMTPSLYYRFNLNEKAKLFHRVNSCVKYVVFGGEPLPSLTELGFILSSVYSPKYIFNLYGTTEVSCWASIDCISAEPRQLPPTLGNPLRETVLKLFDTPAGKEIGIGSSKRFTVVLNENTGIEQLPIVEDKCQFRLTGDCGKQVNTENNSNSPLILIEYVGRTNRTVKRNGSFVDLNYIENFLMETQQFLFVNAFAHMGKIYVLYKWIEYKSVSASSDDHYKSHTLKLTTKQLPLQLYPDRFIEITDDTKIEITTNGKIDQEFLKTVILSEESRSSATRKNTKIVLLDLNRTYELESVIEQIWLRYAMPQSLQRCDCEVDNEKTFFESGGNSIQAILFVENILQAFACRATSFSSAKEKELLSMLLRESFLTVKKYIIETVCSSQHSTPLILKDIKFTKANKENKDQYKWLEPETVVQNDIEDMRIRTEFCPTKEILTGSTGFVFNAWKVPFYGCIDTSAAVAILIDKNPGEVESAKSPKRTFSLAIAGAHSGNVIAVNLSGIKPSIAWVKTLPDRVAAPVVLSPDNEFVFVGCCDNILYCMQTLTGRIKWTFKTNGMIRIPQAIVTTTSTTIRSHNSSYKIIVFDDSSKLACLNEDGIVLNLIVLGTNLVSSLRPLVYNNKVIVVGRNSNLVEVTVTEDDSLKINYFQQDTPAICTELVSISNDPGQMLAYGTIDGTVVAINDNFEQVWKAKAVSGPCNTPIFHKCDKHDEPCLIYSTRNGHLVCLNARNGENKWIINTAKKFNSSVAILYPSHRDHEKAEECAVIAIDMESTVLIFNMTTGEIIQEVKATEPAECFSSPVLNDKFLIFGNRDENLHIYDFRCIFNSNLKK